MARTTGKRSFRSVREVRVPGERVSRGPPKGFLPVQAHCYPMTRSHPLDPLRPGLSLGRISSGAVGGLVGGMAFGVLMLGNFTINKQIGDTGMVPQLQQLL